MNNEVASAAQAAQPVRCIAITPPLTDACGKPAERLVIFKDGDRAPMCRKCALLTEQMAQQNQTSVRVDPLTAAPP